MQNRAKFDEIIFWSIFLFVIVSYILYRVMLYNGMAFTSVMPECFIYSRTGIYCTGCGGTRSTTYLYAGDILHSVLFHPGVLYIYLGMAVYELSYVLNKVSNGKIRNIKVKPLFFYIFIALIVVQCVIKNILLIFYGLHFDDLILSYI